jgi:hypothetical protein
MDTETSNNVGVRPTMEAKTNAITEMAMRNDEDIRLVGSQSQSQQNRSLRMPDAQRQVWLGLFEYGPLRTYDTHAFGH